MSREGDESASSRMYHRGDESPGFSVPHRSDRTIRQAIPPIAALLLSMVALTAPPLSVPTIGQEPLTLGIDANAKGNGPLTLSTIDPCVSVSPGDVFDVDIYIQDVEELLAWEVYVGFDPAILEVAGREVEMFLAGNPGSSVLDVSGRVPEPGLYQVAAADTSDPPTPDSGSGALFRLSLRALDRGTSEIRLIVRDIDGDGLADLGPLLRNVDGEILGDTNGDTIFDGPMESAQVAVDTACEGVAPVTTPTTSSGGGLSAAAWALIGVGSAAVLAASGAGWFALRRRRARDAPPSSEQTG